MIEDFDPDAPSHDALWARARSDYAAGESASAVCERYRLTRSTFFARAKAEGWRRSDGPATGGPDPYVAEMEAAMVFELMGRPATSAYVLARRAWAMAEIALLQRRRIEAQSWIRIARDLRKLAMEETGALTWRRAEQVGQAAMPVQRPKTATPSSEDEAKPVKVSPGADVALDVDGAVTGAPPPGDATAPPAEPALAAEPEPRPAPQPAQRQAQQPANQPDWGLLPLSVLASPGKLGAFLHGEFAEAWAASDSPDRSDRTAASRAPSLSSSSPFSDGEVAAKRTEGPCASTENAVATVPLGEEPSGPLPGFAGTPPRGEGEGIRHRSDHLE